MTWQALAFMCSTIFLFISFLILIIYHITKTYDLKRVRDYLKDKLADKATEIYKLKQEKSDLRSQLIEVEKVLGDTNETSPS